MGDNNEERMESFLDVVKKSAIKLWKGEIGKQAFNSTITKALEDYSYDEDEEKLKEIELEMEKLRAKKITLIGKRKRQRTVETPPQEPNSPSGVSDDLNGLGIASRPNSGESHY